MTAHTSAKSASTPRPGEGRAGASSYAEPDQGDQGCEEEFGALEFHGVGQEEHTGGDDHCDAGRTGQLGKSQFDIGRADRAGPHHPRRDTERQPVREREAERDPQMSPNMKVCSAALSAIAIKEAIRQIAT